jgi:hypothetical protein
VAFKLCWKGIQAICVCWNLTDLEAGTARILAVAWDSVGMAPSLRHCPWDDKEPASNEGIMWLIKIMNFFDRNNESKTFVLSATVILVPVLARATPWQCCSSAPCLTDSRTDKEPRRAPSGPGGPCRAALAQRHGTWAGPKGHHDWRRLDWGRFRSRLCSSGSSDENRGIGPPLGWRGAGPLKRVRLDARTGRNAWQS